MVVFVFRDRFEGEPLGELADIIIIFLGVDAVQVVDIVLLLLDKTQLVKIVLVGRSLRPNMVALKLLKPLHVPSVVISSFIEDNLGIDLCELDGLRELVKIGLLGCLGISGKLLLFE